MTVWLCYRRNLSACIQMTRKACAAPSSIFIKIDPHRTRNEIEVNAPFMSTARSWSIGNRVVDHTFKGFHVGLISSVSWAPNLSRMDRILEYWAQSMAVEILQRQTQESRHSDSFERRFSRQRWTAGNSDIGQDCHSCVEICQHHAHLVIEEANVYHTSITWSALNS